jgi:hypothetical protein
VADTREVYQDGNRVRVDADTNGDGKPDVIQTLSGPAPVQDEDTDFDGVIDRRFQGDQLVPLSGRVEVKAAGFGKLGCGSFDPFWWKR